MTNRIPVKLQDGNDQSISTSLGVDIDGDSLDDNYEVYYQFNAPISNEHVANKDYADSFLGSKEIDTPSAGSPNALYVFNNIDDYWDLKSTDDSIFNAIKLDGVPLSGSPSELQAYIYDGGAFQWVAKDIVNSINRSTAGFISPVITSIATPAFGDVYFNDITSSDNSVNIQRLAVTDDLSGYIDFVVPIVDLENTADGTSKYLLTNPGVATTLDPYQFLGLNTQTPSFISFDIDANNVYINSKNIFGVSQYSMTTGSISANTSETTLRSFTVPANTLTAQGQGLLYIIKGAYQAVGSDLTLKVKFAGSTLVTIPTATLIGNSASSYTLSFTIDYVSSTSFRATTTFIGSDSNSMTVNSLHWIKNTVGTGFDFTSSNTISTTAATGATASLSYAETFLYSVGV